MWTPPIPWVSGAVLSKANLDTYVKDNLDYLKLNIALETAVELTLDTDGIVTKTYSHHTVDTFEDAASDNLVTISGGAEGEVLLLRAANAARTVVVKTGGGNIVNPGGTDVTLDDANDYCLLVHNGTNWIVVGGAAAEEVADTVGAMVTGNTETFITVTYEDGDNTLDFVVPVKDEDDMASNSDVYLATQQSIKAYVDAQVNTHDTFIELTDVPSSYTSAGSKVVAVKSDASGLEFISPTSGSFSIERLAAEPALELSKMYHNTVSKKLFYCKED